MEIQVQSFLAACIVNFLLTSAQLDNKIVNQAVLSKVKDQNEIKENFQNLLYSIAKNDAEKSETIRQILREEDAKEQQAFDAMKVALQLTQNRNAFRKLNFYKQRNGGNLRAAKRETTDPPQYQMPRFDYKPYKMDRFLLEQWFNEMHPELERLDKWAECENLDEKALERICLEVTSSLNMTKTSLRLDEHFIYKPPLGGKESVQKEHIIRNAPMKFWHYINQTFTGTVIDCRYEQTHIYLAEGNGTHVFRVEKDPRDNRFYIKSGLHSVTFTNK